MLTTSGQTSRPVSPTPSEHARRLQAPGLVEVPVGQGLAPNCPNYSCLTVGREMALVAGAIPTTVAAACLRPHLLLLLPLAWARAGEP